MRLSNAIRDRVIEDVLNEKYKETIEIQKEVLSELCETEINEREKGFNLDSVKPFLHMETDVRIYDGNSCIDFGRGGVFRYHRPKTKIGHPLMSNEKNGYLIIPATDEIKAQVKLMKELDKKIQDMKEVLTAVLYSCTTTKQVIETAPELEKYLPSDGEPKQMVALDTVRKLRQMMGNN